MKEKIAKLIDVKSIITLIFGIAFVVFTFLGITTGEQFYSIFQIIIAFYFGTQYQKNVNENIKWKGDIMEIQDTFNEETPEEMLDEGVVVENEN